VAQVVGDGLDLGGGTALLVAERAALELELLGSRCLPVLARLGDLSRQRLDLGPQVSDVLEAEAVLGGELEDRFDLRGSAPRDGRGRIAPTWGRDGATRDRSLERW
jgi:hypothetical protein